MEKILNITGINCTRESEIPSEYASVILSCCSVGLSVAMCTCSLLFVLFALYQICLYKRYSISVPEYEQHSSILYNIQISLNGMMPCIAMMELFFIVFNSSSVSQNTSCDIVFPLLNGILIWPLVCRSLYLERNFKFSVESKLKYNRFLRAFWLTTFVLENITLLIKLLDKLVAGNTISFLNLETVLLFTKYVVLALIFILGSDNIQNSQVEKWIENLVKKYRLITPYIWPKSLCAKIYVLICLCTVGIDRVITISTQILEKKIVDTMSFNVSGNLSIKSFTSESGVLPLQIEFRWDYVVLFVGLNVIESAITDNLRNYLWRKIQDDCSGGVQIQLFSKLHKLSLRWHLEKKIGEVIGSLQSASGRFADYLNFILFSVIPAWLDMFVSVVYFSTVYSGWLSFIIVMTTLSSVVLNIVLTKWREKFLRSCKESGYEKMQQAMDSLTNYETVKYFTNEEYETSKYSEAVEENKKEEMKSDFAYQLVEIAKILLDNIGLLTGSLLCYWMVVNNEGLTVGDYVFFSTYLYRFRSPFESICNTYDWFQTSFVNLEEVMKILGEEPEVLDSPNAVDMKVSKGEITFRNVCFRYVPEKQILHDINFTVPAGKTLALVGPTGSGKSTIIKLLFRFFDLTSGEILIDGQDIKSVTQLSLRKAIGVVPQDTVLFDDTIKNNIKYGSVTTATEAEIFSAAKCACIYDQIETFPDKFETKVGERGLKLSGGEKQRVAIARTVLKNPPILLLDEATSALDTHTERKIQATLQEICKNRTTIIVAHRLSTITHADIIMVLRDGQVTESGTHSELLSREGVYASMWDDQLQVKPQNDASILT